MTEVKVAVLGGSGAGKSGKERGEKNHREWLGFGAKGGSAMLNLALLASLSSGGAVPDPAVHRRVRVQRR